MKNVKLFINDIEVDIDSDTSIGTYVIESEEIMNPMLIKSDNSIQVKLPKTVKNKKALNHIDRVDRFIYPDAINPSQKLPYYITINGELWREGYVKLINSNNKGYDISLFSNLAEFFEDLNSVKLIDLDFEDVNNPKLEHTINKDFIYFNWGDNYSEFEPDDYFIHNTIRYIPVYQGEYKDFSSDKVDIGESEFKQLDYSVDEFGAREFRSYKQIPAIRNNHLIRAIQRAMSAKGYNISSDFFNNINPYYADTFFTLNSFQDRKPVTTKSLATVNQGSSYLGAFTGAKKYVKMTPYDSSDPLYSNGCYNFSNHINSNANINSEIFLQINLIFNKSNTSGSDRYVVSNNNYGRTLNWQLAEDQGFINEGGVTIPLDNMSSQSDYIVYVKNGSNNGILCRRLVDAEADYVINPDFGVVPGAPQLNPNYDGRYGTIYWSMFTPYTSHIQHITEFKFIPQKSITAESGSLYIGYNQSILSINNEWTMYDYLGNPILCNLESFDIQLLTATNSISFESSIATNTTINTSNLFDNSITCKEYLVEYARLFGLYFYIEKNTKNVKINTRVNYYKGSVIKDYNNLLCDDLDYTLEPIVFDNKYLLFNFKDDSPTEYTTQYKSKYNEVYGTQVVNTGYDFNEDKKEVYTSTIFNTLAMVEQYVLPGNGGVTLPCMFNINGNNRSATEVKNCLIFSTKKRIKLAPVNSPYKYTISDDTTRMIAENDRCWNGTTDGTTTTALPVYDGYYTIPYYSTTYTDVKSSLDIARPKSLWSGQDDNSYPLDYSIFNKVFKSWIADRYNVNTKRFTGYFNLSYYDMLTFKLNNFIFFKGIYWIVENCEIDLINSKPCKLTLISVNDITNYITNQDLAIHYLTTDNRDVRVDGYGASQSINIYSSSDWQVDNRYEYDWITYNKYSGGTKGVMFFNIAPNYNPDPRVAIIKLKNINGETDEISVRQEQSFNAMFEWLDNNLVINYNDSNLIIDYLTNMSPNYITLRYSDRLYATMDYTTNQVIIEVMDNDTGLDIQHYVIARVSDYEGKVTDYQLDIKQLARPLYIEGDSRVTIPSDVYEYYYRYTTNAQSVTAKFTSDVSDIMEIWDVDEVNRIITIMAYAPDGMDVTGNMLVTATKDGKSATKNVRVIRKA